MSGFLCNYGTCICVHNIIYHINVNYKCMLYAIKSIKWTELCLFCSCVEEKSHYHISKVVEHDQWPVFHVLHTLHFWVMSSYCVSNEIKQSKTGVLLIRNKCRTWTHFAMHGPLFHVISFHQRTLTWVLPFQSFVYMSRGRSEGSRWIGFSNSQFPWNAVVLSTRFSQSLHFWQIWAVLLWRVLCLKATTRFTKRVITVKTHGMICNSILLISTQIMKTPRHRKKKQFSSAWINGTSFEQPLLNNLMAFHNPACMSLLKLWLKDAHV